MRKQSFAFCICLVFFSLFNSKSFATPVINEFSSADSSDWIEIYNSGTEEIDLSNYRIRDLTANNKLDLSGNLSPNAFISFDWSNKLNNGGDTIKLILIADESIVDQISYGDQGGVAAPSLGQSAGRKTDGGQEWTLFTSALKGSSNNNSTVYLIPSPTPSKIPTPTKTPSPSKTPIPTKIPTIVKNQSTSFSSQASKTPTISKQEIVAHVSAKTTENASGIKTAVKSAKITHTLRAASEFAKIKPVTKANNKKEKNIEAVEGLNLSPFILLSGLFFILAAIAIFLQKILKEKGIL